ncbi:MAG: hypothetical protein HDT27_08750 [Subdoligranulum sp.]|nr:hypothetical protein [Subdoligranulum sp.]
MRQDTPAKNRSPAGARERNGKAALPRRERTHSEKQEKGSAGNETNGFGNHRVGLCGVYAGRLFGSGSSRIRKKPYPEKWEKEFTIGVWTGLLRESQRYNTIQITGEWDPAEIKAV